MNDGFPKTYFFRQELGATNCGRSSCIVKEKGKRFKEEVKNENCLGRKSEFRKNHNV